MFNYYKYNLVIQTKIDEHIQMFLNIKIIAILCP